MITITDENNMKYYDLIILGAGPSGLALAHVSSSIYRNILVIDKEQEIGGIHRVKRDYYGTYSECGPRIYMTAFYNFMDIIRDIGIDYKDIFAKYKYNFITNLLFRNGLRVYEKYILLCAYCKYLLNDNYGKTTILYDYLIFYKFSTSSIDIIDNICVYIDEGNSKTYCLNKFIKLYDILFNSKILVSSKPQDYFLFNVWKKYLENRGVSFILADSIKNINLIDNSVSCVELYSGQNYGCVNLVLAVPPTALVKLLNSVNNSENNDLKYAFGDYEEIERWENELIKEVYRQLRISYINYMDAEYYAVINPNNYYDDKNKRWKCEDNAYYNAFAENYIEFKSNSIENLYNLGTHNGKSYIPFNSIESAISNGIALGRELYPDVMIKYCVRRGIYGKDIVILGVMILYTVIIYYSILL